MGQMIEVEDLGNLEAFEPQEDIRPDFDDIMNEILARPSPSKVQRQAEALTGELTHAWTKPTREISLNVGCTESAKK